MLWGLFCDDVGHAIILSTTTICTEPTSWKTAFYIPRTKQALLVLSQGWSKLLLTYQQQFQGQSLSFQPHVTFIFIRVRGLWRYDSFICAFYNEKGGAFLCNIPGKKVYNTTAFRGCWLFRLVINNLGHIRVGQLFILVSPNVCFTHIAKGHACWLDTFILTSWCNARLMLPHCHNHTIA